MPMRTDERGMDIRVVSFNKWLNELGEFRECFTLHWMLGHKAKKHTHATPSTPKVAHILVGNKATLLLHALVEVCV